MLPTFVIGLREGLEAALIIGIIAAFLIQNDERRALRWMWVGVALAVVLCLGIALVFRAVDRSLPHKQQESLAAAMALLAVAGVTYMIVWMRRHSRDLKRTSWRHDAETALLAGFDLGAGRPRLLRRDPRGPRDLGLPDRGIRATR